MNYLEFRFPGISGVRAVFAGRDQAGDGIDAQGNLSFTVAEDASRVAQNRERLRRELGFRGWHSLRQVHGTRLVMDPEGSTLTEPSRAEGDGLATSEPGLALAVKTADCQPVLIAHASGRQVMALHVGWRGNRAGFPGLAVAAFCARYGLRPSELAAVRGPSLSPPVSEFTNFEMEFGADFRAYFDPVRKTVDLWRLTRDQLIRAGLSPENVHGIDACTLSDPGYFSYRRDRMTGRQAALIWIKQ